MNRKITRSALWISDPCPTPPTPLRQDQDPEVSYNDTCTRVCRPKGERFTSDGFRLDNLRHVPVPSSTPPPYCLFDVTVETKELLFTDAFSVHTLRVSSYTDLQHVVPTPAPRPKPYVPVTTSHKSPYDPTLLIALLFAPIRSYRTRTACT